jgi:hypothetical protein
VGHYLPGRVSRPSALALAIALTVAASAQVAAASPAAPSSRPAASASATGQTTAMVTLLNGDRLAVRSSPTGGQMIAVQAAAGTDSVLSLRLDGTTEEIPTDALPYVGRGLDPGLFSLAGLQREERGGRLPLTISFTRSVPRLPGVTITRYGKGRAAGYLTAASAKVFGAALARQFRADHARSSYGQDGLFAGGVSIALAGARAATRPVRPLYPMHTLTVTGRNLSGHNDTGDFIMVFNAANPEIFGVFFEGFSFFYRGVAKFSVPAGKYWAIGDFLKFSRTGASERLAVLPQFTVKGNTTVHVNERAASSEITMVTPRKTIAEQTTFEMIRGGSNGASNSVSFSDSGLSQWVSPTTSKPTFGSFRSFTSATMTSPPKASGIPYAYNLNYQGPNGIIPTQHYVVSPADLATVNERFYQDVKSTGGWIVFGGFAAQVNGVLFSQVIPVTLPALQTEYFAAGPDQAWQAGYVEFYNSFAGGQTESFRTLPAGQETTEAWSSYPLHPQSDVQLLTGRLAEILPQYPSAFRAGNELNLYQAPFSDNTFGHVGGGYFGAPNSTMIDSYAVYQNGKVIARGNPAQGIQPIKLSAKPAAISFALDAATWGAAYPLSPRTRTVWTWKTAARPAATVPDSWYCGFSRTGNAYKLLRRCAIQPLLTLSYQVQGLSLTGSAVAGPQQIDVGVGHVELAAASAITGASAAYSLNDGQSWQPATVAATGAGQFRIGFNAPAGVDVTLRVSATDAAGGSITETIVRAYGVAL